MRVLPKANLMRAAIVAGAAAIAMGGAVVAVSAADRDPAYDAARSSGKVGEKMDGYIGIVGASTPDLQRVVNDINIKRRAVYASKAQAAGVTIEEYAFTSGCAAIARTTQGEKYQAPNGSWQTRGSGPPQRDARCP